MFSGLCATPVISEAAVVLSTRFVLPENPGSVAELLEWGVSPVIFAQLQRCKMINSVIIVGKKTFFAVFRLVICDFLSAVQATAKSEMGE